MGRVTTNGVVTEYATPNFNPPSNGVVTITTGSDGNLWLTDQSAIGRITPKGSFTSFSVPGNFSTIAGLTSGPGGNVWFTEEEDGTTRGEQPAIGEITPAGVTTLHAIPQGMTLDPNLGIDVYPGVMTAGPDGALWFAENGAIGRITTAGAIAQFPLPTPDATIESITSGPDGAVWFTQSVTDADWHSAWDPSYSIGRITTAGAITVFPLPAGVSSPGITGGRDGDIWFLETPNDSDIDNTGIAIGRITPQGVITTFAVPLRNTDPDNPPELDAITTGPDGNVWFTGDYWDKNDTDHTFIGRITARGSIRLFTLPASVSQGSNSIPYNGSYYNLTQSLFSGPGGKLWFSGTMDHQNGIARISTSGKLGRFIPAQIFGDLAQGPTSRSTFQVRTTHRVLPS